MRLSARGEYALRALVDLALHEGSALVPIADIAARQRIPQRYLEQVLLQVKRAGLAEARRGSAGGYRLGRAAEDITVGSVLRAVEGSAVGAGGVSRPADDAGDLADLLRQIDAAVASVMEQVTLADLRQRAEARQSAARPMYHI